MILRYGIRKPTACTKIHGFLTAKKVDTFFAVKKLSNILILSENRVCCKRDVSLHVSLQKSIINFVASRFLTRIDSCRGFHPCRTASSTLTLASRYVDFCQCIQRKKHAPVESVRKRRNKQFYFKCADFGIKQFWHLSAPK